MVVPAGTRDGGFSLAPLRGRVVLLPWRHIVNAVLAEFTLGIWAVTYLHEVGRAASSTAAVVASVFGIMMFLARIWLPTLLRWFGARTLVVSFITTGVGATVMCIAPVSR